VRKFAEIIYRIITLALTFSAAVSIFVWLSEEQKQQNVLEQVQQQEQEKNNGSSINYMNKSIVVAFTQAFNNRNITALDKLVTVNVIEHNSLARQGLDGVKQYFSDLIAAFPDLHITIDHIIADGNNVAVFTNITDTPAQALISAADIPIAKKYLV
jgi:predicted SnoaL-like aldol condensation-catalyzing enzyme